MGSAHPRLERPERVLDGLAADGHGVRHAVEPVLHLVEDAFVFPALQALVFVGRALGLSAQDEQAVRLR